MGFMQRLFGGGVPQVSPAEASELVTTGAVLLDVREPSEWRAGHAPKARHIPMGEIARRQKELRRDRKILVVCRSGSRSSGVTRQLMAEGFDVANVTGGMSQWSRQGLPVVGSGGRPGTIA